jgi:hypothetical protein
MVLIGEQVSQCSRECFVRSATITDGNIAKQALKIAIKLAKYIVYSFVQLFLKIHVIVCE